MQSLTPHAGEATMRCLCRLHALLEKQRYKELREELIRAEIAHDISELQTLSFEAVLAVADGSGFADDYLEMARALATSPAELAVVAETVAACDWLRHHQLTCLECHTRWPERAPRVDVLGKTLLFALYRLQEEAVISAIDSDPARVCGRFQS